MIEAKRLVDQGKPFKEVLTRLQSKYPNQESQINRLASVIGVHTGPGIIGFTITPNYGKTK